ncbi:hypothetical protein H1C71_008059 [Ictidomys tridecemlineatus]|nr:hypothetical protein H1C71_008059 [Ictidomys tridecemlineatus]
MALVPHPSSGWLAPWSPSHLPVPVVSPALMLSCTQREGRSHPSLLAPLSWDHGREATHCRLRKLPLLPKGDAFLSQCQSHVAQETSVSGTDSGPVTLPGSSPCTVTGKQFLADTVRRAQGSSVPSAVPLEETASPQTPRAAQEATDARPGASPGHFSHEHPPPGTWLPAPRETLPSPGCRCLGDPEGDPQAPRRTVPGALQSSLGTGGLCKAINVHDSPPKPGAMMQA